jgi:hypothetical protein
LVMEVDWVRKVWLQLAAHKCLIRLRGRVVRSHGEGCEVSDRKFRVLGWTALSRLSVLVHS